ncbi:hypothetical protein AB1K91_17915 [Terribacillus sp. 179-K 1B1 HS]|uniref:hypothetical protein n=1 Tax=Terribacillus sp. 179-K 1B1 HS TaxID=3142388 RepID=UPI0039A15125
MNATTEELLAEIERRQNELSKYTAEELANELASRKGTEDLRCEYGGTTIDVYAPNMQIADSMVGGVRIVIIPEGVDK